MNFITNLVSNISGSGSQERFPSSIPFTEDPCSTCEEPCTAHPQIPAYLAKKIEGGELVGTMKPYKRHIMVLEGRSKDWQERLEFSDGMVKVVGGQVDQWAGKAGYRTIVTACDPVVNESVEDSTKEEEQKKSQKVEKMAQIFLFPELVSVDFVSAAEAPTLVKSLLVDNQIPATFPNTPLPGRAWIFVCTHKKRDKRCGVAGPLLVDEFRKAVEEMGLVGEVFVYGCSHFGGHKYAGNIIIYHRNPSVDGNWYGRVRSCHVRPILQTTVVEGKIFKELWRGAMDRSSEHNERKDW
ncbi:uncharacterized protein SPPG_05341 [Spizellomyces punctatus DAOM BR117]|uniref:Sucrase/ferredoxin-like family protein n=1 Tax=Spizellomyces punctatus (strain DAOM BR117) TaxID=645134 RepID=A0A0L0HG09_SPIPD|nr:uncharacterized protein SPPG_05341 [Spizellomyces punctatus DAOM BR117]KNC99966.1 hypothetical protein SPPG_05341 [Spizellomyces punctatus DAOM BR117]|eukprot:XP_016608006.1 hypothetical protein SPPG_05341 [Spizellomyces punctatus DAOM BR117]